MLKISKRNGRLVIFVRLSLVFKNLKPQATVYLKLRTGNNSFLKIENLATNYHVLCCLHVVDVFPSIMHVSFCSKPHRQNAYCFKKFCRFGSL